MRRKGYLLYKCAQVKYAYLARVLDGLVFCRLNFLILFFTSQIISFFQFSDLPPSSVRSRYHGVTFNQDRGHHRASSIFQPTLTGISQRCHQKRTSEAVRISLRKHRLNCLPTTDRTQARPMLKEKKNPSLHIALETYVKLRSVAFRNERKSGLSRHYRPPPPLDGAGGVGAHLIINFSCYYYYYYILPLHCNFGRRSFVIFCDNFTLLFPKQKPPILSHSIALFLFYRARANLEEL